MRIIFFTQIKSFLGNGIDIPMLGYREASREVLGELHELFNDECFKIAQCFLLSTSQVTKAICDIKIFVKIAQVNELNKIKFALNVQKTEAPKSFEKFHAQYFIAQVSQV